MCVCLVLLSSSCAIEEPIGYYSYSFREGVSSIATVMISSKTDIDSNWYSIMTNSVILFGFKIPHISKSSLNIKCLTAQGFVGT